jgi:hypothetical protein
MSGPRQAEPLGRHHRGKIQADWAEQTSACQIIAARRSGKSITQRSERGAGRLSQPLIARNHSARQASGFA